MDSELLLKFIGYFPDYLSALSRTLLRLFFFWTTFVETAVCVSQMIGASDSEFLLKFIGYFPDYNVTRK